MRRLATVTVLGALALLPASALASAYTDVLRVYQASGSIPPCRFSSSELAAALKGIDTYGQQYFADFTEAVQSALAQRAGGACVPGAAARVSQAAESPSSVPLPASVTSPTNADIPAPIIAMAILAALMAAILGVGAGARAFGWEPRWAQVWHHAWAEASYRASGGFDAFADWWRGR